MAPLSASRLLPLLLPCLLTSSLLPPSSVAQIPTAPAPPQNFSEADLFQLALNLEYLESEFYLFSAYGKGLDGFNPELNGGGPPPDGGQKANLSPDTQRVAEMLGLQEIGHIRIIREFLGSDANPRPNISIGVPTWTSFAQQALGNSSSSPETFNPYENELHWLLAAYLIPYVGLTGYVGANPYLYSSNAKALLGGVLGIEGGQDALLRTLLWVRRNETVPAFGLSVAEVAGKFSTERNKLDRAGRVTDEGIEVSPVLAAEGKTSTNILAGNGDSLSYARNPAEVIRILYGDANASAPGGYFPGGITGTIGSYYLSNPDNST